MRGQVKRQSNQRLRYSTILHHLKTHENHWGVFSEGTEKIKVPSFVEGLAKQKRRVVKVFQPLSGKIVTCQRSNEKKNRSYKFSRRQPKVIVTVFYYLQTHKNNC